VSSASGDNGEAKNRWRRLGIACAVLSGVTLVALGGFAWYGYAMHGLAGLAAALVAAGVCWAGALLALLLTEVLRSPQQGASGPLLGMVTRLGLPLATGILLDRRGGPLANAGVFGIIISFYFVTLVAETWLAVRLIAASRNKANAEKAS
jgi:hypothetical protein